MEYPGGGVTPGGKPVAADAIFTTPIKGKTSDTPNPAIPEIIPAVLPKTSETKGTTMITNKGRAHTGMQIQRQPPLIF